MSAAVTGGVLMVTVHHGEYLYDPKWLREMSPYVKVRYGKQKHKTLPQRRKGSNPKFEQTFVINLSLPSSSNKDKEDDCLHFTVADDGFVSDCVIGRVDPLLTTLLKEPGIKKLQLWDVDNYTKLQGFLYVSVVFMDQDKWNSTSNPLYSPVSSSSAVPLPPVRPVQSPSQTYIASPTYVSPSRVSYSPYSSILVSPSIGGPFSFQPVVSSAPSYSAPPTYSKPFYSSGPYVSSSPVVSVASSRPLYAQQLITEPPAYNPAYPQIHART